MNGLSLRKSMFMQPRYIAPSAWTGHLPFAFWIIEAAQPRVFVELGTHAGTSYFGFCQSVVANQLTTKCFAVDTWKGDEHAGFYSDELYLGVKSHHDPLYGEFSSLLRTTFDEAKERFTENSIDLLHIDGLHTYEAVKHDYETWVGKLSNRGVVLFHDTTVKERNFGVWRLWRELSSKFPSFEFEHDHGLGVLAVGNDVPPEILRLCALPTDTEQMLARDLFNSLGQGVKNESQRAHFERMVVIRDKSLAESEALSSERARTLATESEQRMSLGQRNAALEIEVKTQQLAHSELSGRYQEASAITDSLVDRLTAAERSLERLEIERRELLDSVRRAESNLEQAAAALVNSEQQAQSLEGERLRLLAQYDEVKAGAEQLRISFISDLASVVSRYEQSLLDHAAQLRAALETHETSKVEWQSELQSLADLSAQAAANYESQLRLAQVERKNAERQAAENRAALELAHSSVTEKMREDINGLQAALQARDNSLASLQEQLTRRALQVEELERAVSVSESAAASATQSFNAQIAALRAAVSAREEQVRQVLTSRSWRLTKSLRWAAGLWSGSGKG
jgi:O-antigen biosynthesis protein